MTELTAKGREFMKSALFKAMNPAKHFKRPHKDRWRSKRILWMAWLIAVFWSRRTANEYLKEEWTREVLYHTRRVHHFALIIREPLRRFRDYTAMGRRVFLTQPLDERPLDPAESG